MMMAPDRFAEARILEMLAAGGNEFVPLSVLHDASGLPHGQFYNAWGQLWRKFYEACECSLCRTKKKDKIRRHFKLGVAVSMSSLWPTGQSSSYCGFATSTTHTEIKSASRASSDCWILSLTSSAISGAQPPHFVGRHFSVSPNHNTR